MRSCCSNLFRIGAFLLYTFYVFSYLLEQMYIRGNIECNVLVYIESDLMSDEKYYLHTLIFHSGAPVPDVREMIFIEIKKALYCHGIYIMIYFLISFN